MIFLQKIPKAFKIEDKNGKLIDFRLNKAQLALFELVIWQLNNASKNGKRKAGYVRVNIPKARQLGLSTFIKVLELSCAIENIGWNTFTVAHDLDSSFKIFEKVKTAWYNLPEFLKQTLIGGLNNQSTLEITAEGYNQSSKLQTSSSGRSGTFQFLHLSELGQMSTNKQKWRETFSGTEPAVEQAKYVFYESTCDGGLGKYYELTMATQRGETEFDNLFLPWFWGNDYQLEAPKDDRWIEDYQQQARMFELILDPIGQFNITKDQLFWYYNRLLSFKSKGEVNEIKVQYPFTLEEAFVSKSKNKFNINFVLDSIKKANPPVERMVINVNNPNTGSNKEIIVDVYHKPTPANYVMSIDTSSGLGNDYTAIKVRFTDGQKYREFLKVKQKLTEDETVQVALEIARRINSFGRCLIIPEVNFGSYVTNTIRDNYNNDLIYKRYIQDPNKQYDSLVPDFGWKTTGANRDLIINNFVRDFENGLVEVNSLTELDEMKYFVLDEEDNRFEALEGQHDDELMADFICLAGFDYFKEYL